MATLLAHVTVKEGMEERWEEISRGVYAGTHQNEPAVQLYEYWRGEERGTYYVLLSFDDFDGYMEHQVADHHHLAEYGDMFDAMRIEWVDPVAGGSRRGPSTTSGAESADKTDLWNEYVRRMSKTLPEWWAPLRGR